MTKMPSRCKGPHEPCIVCHANCAPHNPGMTAQESVALGTISLVLQGPEVLQRMCDLLCDHHNRLLAALAQAVGPELEKLGEAEGQSS